VNQEVLEDQHHLLNFQRLGIPRQSCDLVLALALIVIDRLRKELDPLEPTSPNPFFERDVGPPQGAHGKPSLFGRALRRRFFHWTTAKVNARLAGTGHNQSADSRTTPCPPDPTPKRGLRKSLRRTPPASPFAVARLRASQYKSPLTLDATSLCRVTLGALFFARPVATAEVLEGVQRNDVGRVTLFPLPEDGKRRDFACKARSL